MGDYMVRYRCGDGCDAALLVENRQGSAYLFSRGALQLRLSGPDACARLAGLLGRSFPCTAVPEALPYTLEGLRRLTAIPAGSDGATRYSGSVTG